MRRINRLLLCSLLLISAAISDAANVATLFSTGLRTNGAAIVESGVSPRIDPHWQLAIGSGSGVTWTNAYLIAQDGMPTNWVTNTPVSQWIGPQRSMINFSNTGEFRYRTQFDLAGYNASNVVLHLGVAADDQVTAVILNNQVTGITFTNGFSKWQFQDLTAGFLSGTNTLELVVTNAAGASGINCQLSATDTPAAVQITPVGTNLLVTWTTNALCYVLESTTNLVSGPWERSASDPAIVGDRYQSIVAGTETARFLRLRRPGAVSPTAKVLVNEAFGFGEGAEWVSFPDIPCSSRGCEISPIDGGNVNTFDASATIDWARCGTNDPTPQFHWTLFFPPESAMIGAPYQSMRPHGMDSPVMVLPPNALPNLVPTTLRWIAQLDIVSSVDPSVSRRVYFLFRYPYSEMTMQDYQNELSGSGN